MALIASIADVKAAARGQEITAFDLFATNQLDPLESPDHTAWSRMISARGVWLEHWPYVPCPCSRSDRNTPDPSCVACHGTGKYYPVERRGRLQALMQARKPSHDQRAAGILTTGIVQFSWQAGQRVGQFDLVFPTVKKGQIWQPSEFHDVNEVLTRAGQPLNNAEIYSMRSWVTQAPEKATPQVERLRYSTIVGIDDIYWRSEETGRVVRATGADYRLVGNVIEWQPERGPAAGMSYTVAYRAPACYMLGEFVHRQLENTVLPGRCDGIRYDQWDPQRDLHVQASPEALR